MLLEDQLVYLLRAVKKAEPLAGLLQEQGHVIFSGTGEDWFCTTSRCPASVCRACIAITEFNRALVEAKEGK